MSKFKTANTDSSLHRIFEGQLRVCSTDNKKNYKVQLMLLNEITNRNKWRYTRVAEHIYEANDIPLLYSAFDGKIGNSHDFEIIEDEKGNRYASFIGAKSEHPYGWIPSIINGKSNAHIENIDGVDWLVATAYLPSYYNVEMIKELETNGNQMPISIETLVTLSHYEGDVEVMDKYSIIGVTILGVDVRPAVANAKVRKLSANGETFQEIKLRVASLADEFNNEPQTQKEKNKEKGVVKQMAKKTLHIEDVKSKFPNHTVLGVNGQTVAMLNEKGRCCSYTFGDKEETVAPEKIEEIAVNAVFGDGDNAVSIPVEQLILTAQAKVNAAEKALQEKTEQCANLEAKVNEMTEAEKKRRQKLVKDAIKNELAENRKAYENDADIDEHLCDEMLTDESINNYAAMEENGEFCGDSKARDAVNAKVNKVVRETKIERKNAATPAFNLGQIIQNASNEKDSGINKSITNILK